MFLNVQFPMKMETDLYYSCMDMHASVHVCLFLCVFICPFVLLLHFSIWHRMIELSLQPHVHVFFLPFSPMFDHSIWNVFGKSTEVLLLSITVLLKMMCLMKLFNFRLKLVLFSKRMRRNKWPLIYIVLKHVFI